MKGYSNLDNNSIVVDFMKQNAIHKVVMSPGSTNIAFVKAVWDAPFFECYSVVDERAPFILQSVYICSAVRSLLPLVQVRRPPEIIYRGLQRRIINVCPSLPSLWRRTADSSGRSRCRHLTNVHFPRML